MSNNEEKRLIAADERRRHSYFENQSKQLRADLARIEAQDRAADERARNFWKTGR
ncbi:hypothetical protein SAMN05216207_105112 [Pseudonocardia ammonioxydans]|uniref:Uncharacterized protein n=1 Tax=Pseudonocardia ammonioxydans TaxID=260086 RepID=A0A1I5GUN5_PSUAM|nr:hypothetical protein [Pseudonocardia ammonioxydans]SFO39647.1 hypothetical protein SAMN05216207_105112 [Pseudonocardia ammonioxydans]